MNRKLKRKSFVTLLKYLMYLLINLKLKISLLKVLISGEKNPTDPNFFKM